MYVSFTILKNIYNNKIINKNNILLTEKDYILTNKFLSLNNYQDYVSLTESDELDNFIIPNTNYIIGLFEKQNTKTCLNFIVNPKINNSKIQAVVNNYLNQQGNFNVRIYTSQNTLKTHYTLNGVCIKDDNSYYYTEFKGISNNLYLPHIETDKEI